MKIQWEFNNTEDITLEDLVGDISITSDEATIFERSTYIDSWLEALITGLKSVRDGGRFTVEVVEETDPLIFEHQGAGVRLLYRDTGIVVENFDEFARAVRSAVELFLLQLDKMQSFNREELQNLADRLKTDF